MSQIDLKTCDLDLDLDLQFALKLKIGLRFLVNATTFELLGILA